jgi:hypothetical protein
MIYIIRWTWNLRQHRIIFSCFELAILLKIDTGGKPTTLLYDKRDYFHFATVNFPYICDNIPVSPAYGVYISHLIRYARACSAYDQFLSRGRLLTDKLMLLGSLQSRISNCEVNNVLNVIIIQRANTKSSVGQEGLSTKAKVGSVGSNVSVSQVLWLWL